MGFDLCVLWQVVSLINLKMKRMLTFEERYLRHNSTSRHLYMPWFALSLTFFSISLPSWIDKRYVGGHFVSG